MYTWILLNILWYGCYSYNTVVTVTLERAAYTIPEGASATLFIAFEGDLHQQYTVRVDINVMEDTANGKYSNVFYTIYHIYNIRLLV